MMRCWLACALAGSLVITAERAVAQATQPVTLASFDDTTGWRAIPSDGVTLALRPDSGAIGQALRFDFDYHGHAGYAIARHAFTLPPLPPHWGMTLHVRGEARPNTIEIKFVDSSGLNVWWMRRVALPVSRAWQELRFRPSDLSFAWGPLGKGPPRGIAAIEIAVTAAAGGAGWIALDELALQPLPMPVSIGTRPRVLTSTTAAGAASSRILPRDFASAPTRATGRAPETAGWHSGADGEQQVTLDFRGPRELSGLAIEWSGIDWGLDYDVQRSDDGAHWTTVREVRGANGGRRFIHLPAVETSWLRLAMHRSSRGHGYGIAAIRVLPAAAAPTTTAFLEVVAASDSSGNWPRALARQQSYWTVVGVPRDESDALMSEDGGVDFHPGSVSVEPVIYDKGHLLTWRDGTTTHSLDGGWRPIPQAWRVTKNIALGVTAFATPTWGANRSTGSVNPSTVWIRYRVVNRRSTPDTIRLSAVVRPVQVNPPWQFLGEPGGAASARGMVGSPTELMVNSEDVVLAVTRGATQRVRRFDAGSIVELLRRGDLPRDTVISDSTGLASGALTWTLALAAHDSADVWLAAPRGRYERIPDVASAKGALDSARALWDRELGAVRIDLPGTGEAMANAVRSSMAYVLINANGPAIQPGTRSYRRSWIRDGALTSSALLRMGHANDVRAFIDWYIEHVFADGKVPCCVDARGADPVTENDADGELLYLVAEYVRITGDTAVASRHWGVLARTAAHLDSLRQTRRTSQYRTRDSLFVFGLLPPSISHEGYSAKPAYSYWDDWWGVRGMADAAFLAHVVRDTGRARVLEAAAQEFRHDVVASVARSMAMHREPVLPGAAELGDFDPTSSTIALAPAQGLSLLPHAAVRATFDSAWVNFTNRRDGITRWENYTPYEWRLVGSYIRLDQPERAHALASWYMKDRRPLAWNEWAEVVWHDARAPKFIGDMPHGWVASDFIRAALDFIEYERADDSRLVVGAGIPIEWARATDGVVVQGIHTWWGTLGLTVRSIRGVVRMDVAGVHPPGGIEVRAPFGRLPKSARMNGTRVPLTRNGRAVLLRAPGTVEFLYR